MQTKQRFWEIDSLRGIAIIMMVIFHFLHDLNYLAGKNFILDRGAWLVFGRTTAVIFITLVGISLTLSYTKAKTQKKDTFGKYFKRGMTIFSWGMLITLMTWIFYRQGFIIFGVLHFIGIAIILAYPFLRKNLNKLNLILGLALIVIGLYLQRFVFEYKWLMWLGFTPNNFYTIDYFPLLPWFGVVLLGLFFGNILYKNHKRRFRLGEHSQTPVIKQLCFMGRHSLLIYLLHEPVLIGLLRLVVL